MAKTFESLIKSMLNDSDNYSRPTADAEPQLDQQLFAERLAAAITALTAPALATEKPPKPFEPVETPPKPEPYESPPKPAQATGQAERVKELERLDTLRIDSRMIEWLIENFAFVRLESEDEGSLPDWVVYAPDGEDGEYTEISRAAKWRDAVDHAVQILCDAALKSAPTPATEAGDK